MFAGWDAQLLMLVDLIVAAVWSKTKRREGSNKGWLMAHGSWLVDNGGSALLPGQGPAPAPMDDARAGVVWGRLDDAQMSSCFAAASSLQFALAPCTVTRFTFVQM